MQTRVKSPMYILPAEFNPRPVCGRCHQHFGYSDGSGSIFTPCYLTSQLMVSTASSHYWLPIDLDCMQKPWWQDKHQMGSGFSVGRASKNCHQCVYQSILGPPSPPWHIFSPSQDSQGCITLVEVHSGTRFWGFVKLNRSALATSQTITNVVQKLSNIDEWVERFVLQIEVGDIM